MSIFGNGVIDGWLVSQEGDFTIGISEGYGNIQFTSARSLIPTTISNLPINATTFIYARNNINTLSQETVEFFTSSTISGTGILLASVQTDSSNITSIDNTVRDEIDFITLIKTLIAQHKHRGGALNPTKIDLQSEVKGQLPSSRIADFDAEKITTGVVDKSRLPLLDHNDLQNIGLLTHAQLDTFVQTLEATNKELFGEIGTTALLQLILALKYIYDNPSSAFYDATKTIDEKMYNELAVIPGISPDSYIDFINSTAVINLVDHYITGQPPTVGSSFYANYDTNLAWNSAYYQSNTIVSANHVSLGFNDADERTIKVIENFESATASGEELDTAGLFTKQTVLVSDKAHVYANNLQSIEGYYSGQFENEQSFRSQFVKEFDTLQDWSSYDSFVLFVKCLDSIHGSVKLYFLDTDGNKSDEYLILDNNEVTSDLNRNNFEMRVVDIAGIPFRSAIQSFVIYTDDLINPFSYYIDYINIQQAVLLPESGTMKIRYGSSVNVTYQQIEWNSTEPTGSSISVRARSANGDSLLTRASYTSYLTSGQIINLEGTDLEIEITFTPNTARTLGPILNSMRILIVADSDIEGFSIDDYAKFSRGSTQNTVINTSPVYVSLDIPVYVDSYYFALSNAVNQIYNNTSVTPNFIESEVALFGANAPIAPNQIFRSVEDNTGSVTIGTLSGPRGVVRLENRNFLISDTYNDRVLEMDESGTLVAGYGGINYEHDSKIFPISSSYDVRSGILYIIWSRKIPLASVVVSKITLQTTTQKMQLTVDSDKILNMTTSQLQTSNPSAQIMPVYLSAHNQSLAAALPATSSYVSVSSDAISGGISLDSVFYKNAKTALGIPCFIGNFAYLDNVFSPTSTTKTTDGRYWTANGIKGVKNYVFPDAAFTAVNGTVTKETITQSTNASSIVEVTLTTVNSVTTTGVSFASDIVNFSPFIPGKVEEIDTDVLLIGGMRPGVEKKETLTFRNLSGDAANKKTQKEILNTVFLSSDTPFVGTVLVYDKKNLSTLFEYISPEGMLVSDVVVDPTDGLYMVAESSFSNTGRIIKLDLSGNIVSSLLEGTFGIINAIRVKYDGSVVVST